MLFDSTNNCSQTENWRTKKRREIKMSITYIYAFFFEMLTYNRIGTFNTFTYYISESIETIIKKMLSKMLWGMFPALYL